MSGFLKRLFESKDTTELRESIEALQKQMRRMEEEWTEVYNRFRTLQMRVAKQVQRLDASSSNGEPQTAESVDPSQPGLTLSARQRLINEQVLARRRRELVPEEE